jgi:hypothetical protein
MPDGRPMTGFRPDPLMTITKTTQMADNVKNGKLAFTLTALSIGLVAMMALREFKELFSKKAADEGHHRGFTDRVKESRCYDRDEAARHRR